MLKNKKGCSLTGNLFFGKFIFREVLVKQIKEKIK